MTTAGRRPGRPELTAEETTRPTPDRVAAWMAAGFPWCDECGMPAVFKHRRPGRPGCPGVPGGWRHADGRGRPVEPLPGGHRVTAFDWHDVGPLVDVVEWTPMSPVAGVAYH